MSSRYLFFFIINAFLTAAVWSEGFRYRYRMVLFASLGVSFIYIARHIPKYIHSKYFWWMLGASPLFFISCLHSPSEALRSFATVQPTCFLLPFVSVGILLYILIRCKYKMLIMVLIFAVPIIVVSAAMTIRAPINASRIFVGNAVSVDSIMIVQDNLANGVLGYAQIHSLPLLMGSLACILRYSEKLWQRVFALFAFILCFFAIIRSGYTSATLCMVFTTMICFFSVKHRALTICGLILSMLLIMVLIKTGFVLSMLETIAPSLGKDSALAAKIKEFADETTTVNGSSYWAIRLCAYGDNWKLFLENPIFGAGIGEGPGHSWILGTLATSGLVFTIPYSIFSYLQVKLVYMCLPKKYQWHYIVLIVSLFLLLIMKAPGLIAQNHTIFLLAPLLMLINKSDFYEASCRACKVMGVPSPNIINCWKR